MEKRDIMIGLHSVKEIEIDYDVKATEEGAELKGDYGLLNFRCINGDVQFALDLGRLLGLKDALDEMVYNLQQEGVIE